MTAVIIPYRPRPQFEPLHDTTKRWRVVVAHRRAGKTVALINDILRSAVECTKMRPRFAYVAPHYVQAKDVAWAYLKHFAGVIPGVAFNEAELRCDLPNKAQIRLYGADNYDRLRGIYLDGLVADEYADFPEQAWPSVLRPALADREGWAVLCGTPKGRNAFWEAYRDAQNDPEWFTLMLKASETGLLPDTELQAMLATMGADRYAQELECSFDAAVIGSYYGSLLDEAQTGGRITSVPHDPAAETETWWDLGVGDSTAIWFVQRVGMEIRVIDFYEMTGEGLPHYAKVLKDKPYIYGRHVAPHDIGVREFSTGRSRLDIARDLGIRFDVAPRLPIDDGINAVRVTLPRCWFDATKCADGLEKLRLYRKDYDERLKAFRDRPRHDFTSHAADAFRTGCQVDPPRAVTLQQPKLNVSWQGSQNAWMG